MNTDEAAISIACDETKAFLTQLTLTQKGMRRSLSFFASKYDKLFMNATVICEKIPDAHDAADTLNPVDSSKAQNTLNTSDAARYTPDTPDTLDSYNAQNTVDTSDKMYPLTRKVIRPKLIRKKHGVDPSGILDTVDTSEEMYPPVPDKNGLYQIERPLDPQGTEDTMDLWEDTLDTKDFMDPLESTLYTTDTMDPLEDTLNILPLDTSGFLKIKMIEVLSADDKGLKTGKCVMKTHYCTFCSKGQKKIVRHLQKKHLNEPEVVKLKGLTEGSAERKRWIAYLKNLGNFKHNLKTIQEGKGTFIVARKPKGLFRHEDFEACPNCYVFFSIGELVKHAKTCPMKGLGNGNDQKNEAKKRFEQRKFGDKRTRYSPEVRHALFEHFKEQIENRVYPKKDDFIEYLMHAPGSSNVELNWKTAKYMIANRIRIRSLKRRKGTD